MTKYGYDSDRDNLGKTGIDTSGDVTIGLGSGIGMDVANGDLTVNGIDTGLQI